MRRRHRILCLVVALGLVPWGAGHAWADRNGRRILFSAYGDNTAYHVFSVRLDGTGLTKLSRRGGGFDPAWSSDGRRIAYVQFGEGIVVMRKDGSHRGLVTKHGSTPQWSPDDSRLLFTRWCCDEFQRSSGVFVARPDGTRIRRLAHTLSRRRVSSASWSPDGRLVSYIRTPTRCSLTRCVRDKLFLVSRRGGDETLLFRRDGIHSYDWSPDGSRIVVSCRCGRDQDDLYVIDVSSGKATRITDTPGSEAEPDWSPSGDEVLALRWRADFSGAAKLIRLSTEGSSEVTVASRLRESPSPSWSPNGARIVFLRYFRGVRTMEVFVIDADGTDETRVTDDRLDQVGPSWQPR
ncbi:MAG: hypothetical protein M3271_07320 [Actinomycetota bacterium]|nr:hypothetical protein [Actinomycetota bacterium]